MNQLIIYYHSDNDALGVVNNARDRANAKAAELGKQLSVSEVDIKNASDEAKKHFSSGGTIECVLVVEDKKITSFIYSSPQQIENTVANL